MFKSPGITEPAEGPRRVCQMKQASKSQRTWQNQVRFFGAFVDTILQRVCSGEMNCKSLNLLVLLFAFGLLNASWLIGRVDALN